MSPADAARLNQAPADRWRALAERLHDIGFSSAYLVALSDRLAGLPGHLLQAGLAALTWADEQPAALAARLLMLGDALPGPQVDRIFGALLARQLADAGLLEQAPDGWRLAWRMEIVNGLFLLSDLPGAGTDTVMCVGGSTQLLAAACYPQVDLGRALDLGCGCGTLALLLAMACERVVATDINPRALALARVNAALNAIPNIEFRAGEGFEPVAGESFDLIASQPPFVPLPPEMPPVTYLHGGARGDELALRLLRQAPRHLAPGGTAVMLSDFPVLASPLRTRLAETLPGVPVQLLHQAVPTPAATQATLYGGACGGVAIQEAHALHAHLRALGIEAVQQAVVVVRTAGGGGVYDLPVPNELWSRLHRTDIDRAWAVRQLSPETLQAMRMRPADTAIVRRSGPLAGTGEPRIELDLVDGTWLGPLSVADASYQALQTLLESASVAEALVALGGQEEQAAALELARQALLRGLVQAAPQA